jgi:hypothetical protein
MTKSYGEGIYSAYRQDGILHVRAHGSKPSPQTKVSIDELPFFIFPPEYGLFFETDGIASPLVLPYDIERAIPTYPIQLPTIHIVDRNGSHTIDIEDRPRSTGSTQPDPATQQYVVYQQLGTNRYLIAKADAVVIEIYKKVFGPDSYENCRKFVAEHTPPVETSIDIVPGSLKAWLDLQPGSPPRLIVTAEAVVEIDWQVEIVAAVPPGINPFIKLLKLDIQIPTGPHSNAIATRTLRYEEAPAGINYTDVTLLNGGQGTTVKVGQVH